MSHSNVYELATCIFFGDIRHFPELSTGIFITQQKMTVP